MHARSCQKPTLIDIDSVYVIWLFSFQNYSPPISCKLKMQSQCSPAYLWTYGLMDLWTYQEGTYHCGFSLDSLVLQYSAPLQGLFQNL